MTALASQAGTSADAAPPDPRDPELRLAALFDADTLVPLRPRDSSGVFTPAAAPTGRRSSPTAPTPP